MHFNLMILVVNALILIVITETYGTLHNRHKKAHHIDLGHNGLIQGCGHHGRHGHGLTHNFGHHNIHHGIGHHGLDLGHPSINMGHTGVGHHGLNLFPPGVFMGHTRIGYQGIDVGHPGISMGHHGYGHHDLCHNGINSGHHGIRLGHHGKGYGNHDNGYVQHGINIGHHSNKCVDCDKPKLQSKKSRNINIKPIIDKNNEHNVNDKNTADKLWVIIIVLLAIILLVLCIDFLCRINKKRSINRHRVSSNSFNETRLTMRPTAPPIDVNCSPIQIDVNINEDKPPSYLDINEDKAPSYYEAIGYERRLWITINSKS